MDDRASAIAASNDDVDQVRQITMTVMGQVKAGKSSLINALLGEQLARTEQDALEVRHQELLRRAAGAVQHQHDIRGVAAAVDGTLAERHVVDLQPRQRLAAGEAEVGEDGVAGDRFRLGLGGRGLVMRRGRGIRTSACCCAKRTPSAGLPSAGE